MSLSLSFKFALIKNYLKQNKNNPETDGPVLCAL